MIIPTAMDDFDKCDAWLRLDCIKRTARVNASCLALTAGNP